MKIEKVNCLVSLDNDGKETIITQVPKAGPSAVSVTEIPLMQAQNGPNSVTRVHSAGFFEAEKRDELSRLAEIYPEAIMKVIYPGQNAPLPKTIADLDLPDQHLFDAPKMPVEEAEVVETSKDDEIAALKAQLAALLDFKEDEIIDETVDAVINGGIEGDVSHETPEPATKAEWRDALKAAGVEVPLGNYGIPALKAMMPKQTEDA